MNPGTVYLAAEEAAESTTWPWLAEVEKAINDTFDPIANAVAGAIFYAPTIFGVAGPADRLLAVVAAADLHRLLQGHPGHRVPHRDRPGAREVLAPSDPGEVTHFQALSSAVSGTVGLGNIAGVGVAVTVGGPGATFWMILAGLLGMATKFVECTLGVRYREMHEDGTVTGGPFRYLPVAFERFGSGVSRGAHHRLRHRAVLLRRGRRQHVPGQPDLRPGAGGHRRRGRLPRQPRLGADLRPDPRRWRRRGHPRRAEVDRRRDEPAGSGHGRRLPRRGLAGHPRQRRPGARAPSGRSSPAPSTPKASPAASSAC